MRLLITAEEVLFSDVTVAVVSGDTLVSVITKLAAEVPVAEVTGGRLTSLVVSGGLIPLFDDTGKEMSCTAEVTGGGLRLVIMQVDTEGTVAKVVTGTLTLLAAKVALQASKLLPAKCSLHRGSASLFGVLHAAVLQKVLLAVYTHCSDLSTRDRNPTAVG